MHKSKILLMLSFLLPSCLLISCSAPTPTTIPPGTNRQTPLARTPRAAATLTPTPAARIATSTAINVAIATPQGVFSRTGTIYSTFPALPGSKSYVAQQYYEEAESYMKQVEFGKAVESYTEAIQLKPDFVGAYLQRGLAYCFQHDTDDAIADWKKIRELPSYNWIDENSHAKAANFVAAFSSGC